jgi:hypothetical protein
LKITFRPELTEEYEENSDLLNEETEWIAEEQAKVNLYEYDFDHKCSEWGYWRIVKSID